MDLPARSLLWHNLGRFVYQFANYYTAYFALAPFGFTEQDLFRLPSDGDDVYLGLCAPVRPCHLRFKRKLAVLRLGQSLPVTQVFGINQLHRPGRQQGFLVADDAKVGHWLMIESVDLLPTKIHLDLFGQRPITPARQAPHPRQATGYHGRR